MAVPTPTADPRDALFYANEAALNFQQGKAEASDKAARENAEAGYRYGNQQQRAAFKLRIPTIRNQANAQGLAESGINAQRQQQAGTDYASKQNRLGEIRTKAVAQANQNDLEAQKATGVGQSKNLAEAQDRAAKNLIENPPPEAQTPTAVQQGAAPSSQPRVNPNFGTQLAARKPLQFGFKEAEAREAAARRARKR
jgi:hypothetical protein